MTQKNTSVKEKSIDRTLLVLWGFVIGLLVNSLSIAVKHEFVKPVRETIFFLQRGTNLFWMYVGVDVFLIFLLFICHFIIIKLVYKKNDTEQ